MSVETFQGNRFRIDGEIGEILRSWFNVTLCIVVHTLGE